MKIKYILSALIMAVLVSISAYAQDISNAVTIPVAVNDMTAVNLREEASTQSAVLGAVGMYTNIYVNGETDKFYSGAAVCTDGVRRAGFISKDFVKVFEALGTAYVSNYGGDKYNMSFAPVYCYPHVSGEKKGKIPFGTNVNLLYGENGWFYCEYGGSYGYVPGSYLQPGWNSPAKPTQTDISMAEKIGLKSILLVPNDSTVVIGGKAKEVGQPVISYYNSTMMPIRGIAEIFGGSVSWNDSEKSATATAGGKTIRIKNNSNVISVDGTDVNMSAKSFIRDSRLYVPIRSVTDALGMKIYYFGQGMPFIVSYDEFGWQVAKCIMDKYMPLFSHHSGLLAWPVPSSSGLSSSFGDGRGHKAIDITGKHGAVITASGDGVVTEVFNGCTHDYPKSESCCGGGYGNYVVVTHSHTINGHQVKTRYSHLARTDVTVGQLVSTGDTVGYMGCTGRSTGNHLDFELSLDDVKTDPAGYISVPKNLYDSGNNALYTKPYIDKLQNMQKQ